MKYFPFLHPYIPNGVELYANRPTAAAYLHRLVLAKNDRWRRLVWVTLCVCCVVVRCSQDNPVWLNMKSVQAVVIYDALPTRMFAAGVTSRYCLPQGTTSCWPRVFGVASIPVVNTHGHNNFYSAIAAVLSVCLALGISIARRWLQLRFDFDSTAVRLKIIKVTVK